VTVLQKAKKRRIVVKTSVCFSVLIVAFLIGVSYAQDQQKAQPKTKNPNKVLDKAEYALRRKFGPAILSITRDFRNPALVIEFKESAMSKIRDSKKPSIPMQAAAVPGAAVRDFDYSTKEPVYKDPMHKPAPPKVKDTYTQVIDTIKHLPVTPSFEPRSGGGIIKIRITTQ
jgi:hypothetical protein